MTGRWGTTWYGHTKVGTLRENESGRLSLSYDAEWERSGFAISISLPIVHGQRHRDAHAFFAGLLPEGLARRRICRKLRINELDDVALLLSIGRDCAGALTIVPGDSEPTGDDNAVAISDDDFDRLVQSHGQAIPQTAQRQRFSLAGAQDKVAVLIDDETMWLPNRNRASSHILKFETTKQVCFAEYAAHDMARRLGLDVAATSYHRHGEDQAMPYLRIQRYDRAHNEAGVLCRLHQEDMTQALGYASAEKYQDDGGPCLGTIAQLLRTESTDPVRDINSLRDWQLFNYLIGNADGHAKNLALLYPAAGEAPRLAPAYDLVAIEFLNRLGMSFNRNMAFFIGDHNVPEQITQADWIAMAKAIHVPAKILLSRLHDLAEALPATSRATRGAFAEQFGDNQAYDKLEESVTDRCGWVLRNVRFG